MGVIGLSLLVASVVLFCLRPPQWLPRLLPFFRQQRIEPPPTRPPVTAPENHDDDPDESRTAITTREEAEEAKEEEEVVKAEAEAEAELGAEDDPVPQPSTIPPVPVLLEPTIHEHPRIEQQPTIPEPPAQPIEVRVHEDEQTTPKVTATPVDINVPSLVLPELSEPPSTNPPTPTLPDLVLPQAPAQSESASVATPSLSLSTRSSPTSNPAPSKALEVRPPSRIPTPPKIPGRSPSPRRENVRDLHSPTRIAPPSFSSQQAPPPPPRFASSSAASMMPPPPVPKKSRPSSIPQLASLSSTSSPRRIPTLDTPPNRDRTLPIPRRSVPGGPTPASSSGSLGVGGLAPPPTHSSVPKKPSRQVTLEPGHSPMDWARLAQSPTSDLRNLPPNTPYLRVTLSMLKQMNGRKGRDAWSVYGGKVYNVSPYIPFHPGGGGELLRGAGKDATRLFGEVHPWVNFETMLSACLIGILVEEHEAENKMEEMD